MSQSTTRPDYCSPCIQNSPAGTSSVADTQDSLRIAMPSRARISTAYLLPDGLDAGREGQLPGRLPRVC